MKPYKPSEAVEWLERDYDVTFASDACGRALININDSYSDRNLPPEYVIHYRYNPPMVAPDYYTHIRTMIEVIPIHGSCYAGWSCSEYR